MANRRLACYIRRMARPCNPRRVKELPGVVYFKPAGVPLFRLREVVLPLDEFEAIRLADREGLEHAEAASRMGVSRPTFTRILRAARRKMAEFLGRGAALRIEGGAVARLDLSRGKRQRCRACLRAGRPCGRADCPCR